MAAIVSEYKSMISCLSSLDEKSNNVLAQRRRSRKKINKKKTLVILHSIEFNGIVVYNCFGVIDLLEPNHFQLSNIYIIFMNRAKVLLAVCLPVLCSV